MKNFFVRFVAVTAVVLTVAVVALLASIERPPEDAPRVLVSVDRTWWNRLGFNRFTFARALRTAGVQPLFVDFERAPVDGSSVESLLDGVDGLIISGGGDVEPKRYGNETRTGHDVNPLRDSFELALLGAAERRSLPVLGICRGAQLINVHRGGSLGDLRADRERYRRHRRVLAGHPVSLQAGSRLADIYDTTTLVRVATFHGQFVDTPGAGLRIVGRAADGTPEAIESIDDDGFGTIGVQWHAELRPFDHPQARLFNAFAAATRERAVLDTH